MSGAFTKHKWVLTAVVLVALYVSPYVFLGEDAHVRTHDNLDSNVVWFKILAESGQIFAPSETEIPHMLGGLPRGSYGSEFNFILWLFVWFEPFTAYAINETLMRFVAFFGMYLLLQRHVIQGERYKFIASGVALAFSFLPFLPTSGLSFAGMPLVLYAFLNIRAEKATGKDWLILLLVPFYSSLVLTFAFFLAAMGVVCLVDWMRTKRLNGKFLIAIVMMGAVYLLVEYRLVYETFVASSSVPHRVEFNLGHKDVWGAVKLGLEDFHTAHTHDISLHEYVVLFAIGLALIVSRLRGKQAKWLAFFIVLSFGLSLWYGFWYWEGMRFLKDRSELLNTFNFARFHFLSPLIWYVAFALALRVLADKTRWMNVLAVLLVISQVGYVTYAGHPEIKYQRYDSLSYREFYSEELFKSIQDDIGRDPADYRVVSIGMHPAIPLYSGFHTVDGYITSYPLEYKHAFRDVIAPELEKNKTIRHYFDTWGSRCYVFTDELGKHYTFTKDKEKEIDHLELDTEALKTLGGEYVLSAVKINNSEATNLKLLRTFESEQSPWKIYVYEVTGGS